VTSAGPGLRDLPLRCHVVLPGLPAGSNVAICVRGEQGVRLTRLDFGDAQQASAIVRAFNASLGIPAAAERAMLAGCLLGWHSTGVRILH
jgi:hypothetical protein